MRILCCSLASEGFLYPLIGISKELEKKGHSVAFATDLSMCEDLASVGLERIARGRTDGASFQLPFWAHPESIAIQVKHVEWAVKVFHPDIVIGQHLTLGPLMVREMYHIPTAIIGSLAYLWPTETRSKDLRLEGHKQWRYNDVLAGC